VAANHADVLIVGAGIIGLAHAWIAAKKQRKVAVIERRPAATGASIANFGLLWPIGQPSGRMLTLAMQSRALWLEMLQETAIPYSATGSLHIACREDEAQLGKEFASLAPALGYRCSWLDRDTALTRSAAIIPEALLGALWSETEITVDPREVLRRLPEYLNQHYGVEFHWGCPVLEIHHPHVQTSQRSWHANQVIVCTGSDFEILYPDFFRQSGITRCRLQMLRTPPQPAEWELGPAIAGGLTFRFYPSFDICPSLPKLRARINRETPEYDRFGIHTMVSQASSRELTLGDSHEYGLLVSPFSREEIDTLILRHLRSFLRIPDFSIAQRWYGVYAKHPQHPYVRFQPEEGVEVITALGGAGMTLSFGVAAETFRNLHTKAGQA
jgi:D-hydroxyproline dehydrogenase subunit beta